MASTFELSYFSFAFIRVLTAQSGSVILNCMVKNTRVAALFWLAPALALAAGFGIEEKVSLEKSITDKVQQVAVPFLGTSEFMVWTDVTVDLTQTTTQTTDTTKPDPSYKVEIPQAETGMPGVDEEFLPSELQSKIPDSLKIALAGRPIIRSMENSMKLPQASIKSVRIRMVVPSRIPADRIKTLQSTLEQLVPIAPARGDALEISPIAFQRDPIERFLYWKDRLGTTVFWAFATLMVTGFMFGPVRSFLNRLAGTMENFEIKTTSSVKELIEQKEAKEKALTGGPAGLLGGPGGKPGEEAPFGYIRAENMTKLLWTLEAADAPTIAVVAAHLAPDLSSQLIASLEPDRQKEVLLQLASPQSVDKEIIVQLNAQLKAQMESVVGGLDHILNILDQQPPDKQAALLEELRTDRPDVVENIQGRLLTLDKVFKLPKANLQGILWEAYRQRITLGILLKPLQKDLQQAGLAALPETLTRVVADEMNLPSTPAQLDTERRKFMALVRNLEKAGRVSFAVKT